MKKSIISFAVILILSSASFLNAQDYRAGVGMRLGAFTSGVTFKGFVGTRGALEGMAGFGRRSFHTTLLYEHHIPIPSVQGLNLYVGGGGHAGFFRDDGTYLVYKYRGEKVYVVGDGRSAVVPGADFIFGAEYKFKNVPIVVGADMKPFIDFYDGVYAYPDLGIFGRFVF
jgi:hypothetical protein